MDKKKFEAMLYNKEETNEYFSEYLRRPWCVNTKISFEDFKEKFYLNGHMNACGYLLTAKMIVSYIDYIIRHNIEDFNEVGFIGTDLFFDKQ